MPFSKAEEPVKDSTVPYAASSGIVCGTLIGAGKLLCRNKSSRWLLLSKKCKPLTYVLNG